MTAIADETTSRVPQTTAAAISGVVDLADGRGIPADGRLPPLRPATSPFPPPRSASTASARSGDHIEGTTGKAQQGKAQPAKALQGPPLLTVESVNGRPAAGIQAPARVRQT